MSISDMCEMMKQDYRDMNVVRHFTLPSYLPHDNPSGLLSDGTCCIDCDRPPQRRVQEQSRRSNAGEVSKDF